MQICTDFCKFGNGHLTYTVYPYTNGQIMDESRIPTEVGNDFCLRTLWPHLSTIS